MTDHNEKLWQTKLHARLHDPAEKPLVLMRTPGETHEQGTSAALRRRLFGSDAIPEDLRDILKIADRWAAAGDRPNFPNELLRNADGSAKLNDKTGEPIYSKEWANVRFASDAQFIHPLSGQRFPDPDQGDPPLSLQEIGPQQIKSAAFAHFERLIVRNDDGSLNPELTSLTFWRFGPHWSHEAGQAGTGADHVSGANIEALPALWSLLPADSRTPDHTIWQHLDLASAYAGALHGGDTPALLTMSIGPVQDFIAASRSLSDLWAGSHLLSRIAWEGIKLFCETLGPDAVLMPQVRGIPQVDAWIYEKLKGGRDAQGEELRDVLFAHAEWRKRETDANPLFAAALPNKWLAIVPASRAKDLAAAAALEMRHFVRDQARAAYRTLLGAVGEPDRDDLPGYAQIDEQLRDFPEVHWSAAPWTLAGNVDKDAKAQPRQLAEMLRRFYPGAPEKPGFLGSDALALLTGDLTVEGQKFYEPNPGLLYPALHDLNERTFAAAKALRPFTQWAQQGYRCSLTGDGEWLTTDRSQLALPPGQRDQTLWARVARQKKTWLKPGEHLGALATLKRLWPTLFVRELAASLDLDVDRFVVSSHTMALAPSLESLMQTGALDDAQRKAMSDLKAHPCWEESENRVALPRKLERIGTTGALSRDELRKLPAVLDAARESERDGDREDVERLLAKLLPKPKGGLEAKPEAYYALIKLDGDSMGAWVNGKYATQYRDAFHTRVRDHLVGIPALQSYLDTRRAVTPSYHMALSGALNRFSLELARRVVEDAYMGRLLYAGGDDVMAMTTTRDLLPTLLGLRCVYSGMEIPGQSLQDVGKRWNRLRLANGFMMLDRELIRLMGEKASASAGAVIAHYMAPLSAVLRELDRAEKRAKNEGGRNAFSLTVVKRSGGALFLTLPWDLDKGEHAPALELLGLAQAIAAGSRRATFNVMQWIRDLPLPAGRDMLRALLGHQFRQQKIVGDPGVVTGALQAWMQSPAYTGLKADEGRDNLTDKQRQACVDFLYNYLSVAEFLAREGRVAEGALSPPTRNAVEGATA